MRLVIGLRQFFVCWLVFGFVFMERTHAAQPNETKVCVQNPSEALWRLLGYHERHIRKLMRARSIPQPKLENDNTPIAHHIHRYLLQVKNSALLAYAADSTHLCAFLWHEGENGDEQIRLDYFRTEIDSDELSSLVGSLRHHIEAGFDSSTRGGRRRGFAPSIHSGLKNMRTKSSFETIINSLSSLLFPGPFKAALSRTKHLSIVPIKDFSSMPVVLLHPLGDEQIVLDRFSVNFLPGLKNVKMALASWPRRNAKALIVGNPAVSNDEHDYFPSLPGAEKEAEIAHKLFGGVYLPRQKALREAAINNMKNAAFIYIAAHGYSDPKGGLEQSFIALAREHLTARQVQGLSFKKQPVVTLSACQTGIGRVMEAGIIGIARAFQLAGASNTVMSLWSVDDEATLFMMSRYLKAMKKHPPAVALRVAMRATRDTPKFTNPIYWAAFNVFGNHMNAK